MANLQANRTLSGSSFEKRGSAVTVRFTVRTVYESFTQTTEVMTL